MKKNIALIYGGASEEHDVSLRGYPYVRQLLEKNNYNVIPLYITRESIWMADNTPCGTPVFLKRTSNGAFLCYGDFEVKIDAAVPLLHGEGGEGGEIQGLLESCKIPYVGADVVTGAVCLDKHFTKCVAKRLGIPTAKWVSFSENCDTHTALTACENEFGFPLFIKPRRLGSSIGACAVNDRCEFATAFRRAMEIGGNRVIAEELIENKREVECAFYKAKGEMFITHPAEILCSGFYGYETKYNSQTKTVVKADLSEGLANRIKAYALNLSEELGLRHLGRIDFFLRGDEIFFNEINTFPGFTPTSLYPLMLQNAGISPEYAIKNFIEDAAGW